MIVISVFVLLGNTERASCGVAPKSNNSKYILEKIGRVCYKSEDKITEDGESAKKSPASADVLPLPSLA